MTTGVPQNVGRPEYMNATPHHSKVRVSLGLSSSLFVAGQEVTGKMDMECRSDGGVGIGLIMVELFAIQELNSRDHSASSTFLHTRRLFQGPGLPPSNAVDPHPTPGQPPLPQGHFPARRGITSFFFQFPIPLSSPSSVSFASGLARVRYEVRASIGVAHKGEKRVVTDNLEADVVQCEDMDGSVAEHVVVGENGKIYVQGRIVGGRIVSGQQACVELRVKNHSSKKTTGLSLSLSRTLQLHDNATTSRAPLQLTDMLFSQTFRGTDYCVQAGAEGVANLVFDVPKAARVVKGGIRHGADDDEGGRRRTEALFELKCILGVKIGMGIGSKDIMFEMPVQLSHPATLSDSDLYMPPAPPPVDPLHGNQSPRAMSPVFEPPNPYFARSPGSGSVVSSPSYPFGSPPISSGSTPPPQQPYYQPASPLPLPQHAYPTSPHQHLWSPPPPAMSPLPYLDPNHVYYFPPPPVPLVPFDYPARPNSAGVETMQNIPPVPAGLPSGLPGVGAVGLVFPTFQQRRQLPQPPLIPPEPQDQQPTTAVAEEGKGLRASRISQHLRTSTRARSVSPTSHRFPGPPSAPAPGPTVTTVHATSPRHHGGPPVLSPRPVISPRNSFSADVVAASPVTPDAGGTAKSGRVDLLERMVDLEPGEEGKSVEDVLRDLEKAERAKKEKETDKTLPKPPVPSGKLQASKRTSGVPKASDVFGLQVLKEKDEPVMSSTSGQTATAAKSVLRPSPMARRISTDDKEKKDIMARGTTTGQGGLLRPQPVRSSGLDALETRLLQEVGTRKPDKPERPTIFGLGMAASEDTHASDPRPMSASTQLVVNDSEISSLALASNGSTEMRAHKHRADMNPASVPMPVSPPAEEIDPKMKREERILRAVGVERDRPRVKSDARERDQDRLKEEKVREREALKLRKAAKGRVADWLGGMSATPGSEGEPTKDSSSRPARKTSGANGVLSNGNLTPVDVQPVSPQTLDPKPLEAPPKPEKPKALRSPIAPAIQSPRSLEPKSPPIRGKLEPLDVKKLSSKSGVEISSSPRLTSPPPIALPKPVTLVSPRLLKPTSPVRETAENVPELDKLANIAPKLLTPRPTPDTKYDVRSARGGKGGIATSVAALWSSRTEEPNKEKSTSPPSRPAGPTPVKRPAFLDVGKGKASPTSTKSPLDPTPVPTPTSHPQQPRNMVKAASVPATVISSHAKPHLSSTASLARPALPASKSKPPSLSPTLDEDHSEVPATKARPAPATEMAFGQARLKDLIKKYQQATS